MYLSEVSIAPTGSGRNITSVIPRLEVHHDTQPGLTPVDIDVRGSAVSMTDGPAAFSVDDAGMSPPFRAALSFIDANAPSTDGPLFRSGELTALPPPSPADRNGFISIGPLGVESVAFTDINAMITAGLTSASPPPGVTLAAGTLAPSASNPNVSLLTVTGTWDTRFPPPGAPGLPVGILAFTYTADLVVGPFTDAFRVDLFVTAALNNPSMVFTPVGPVDPVVDAANAVVSFFLNPLDPIITPLVTERVLVREVGGMINSAARARVAAALGSTTGINPAATVSVQRVFVSTSSLNSLTAAGSVGPLISLGLPTGIGCPIGVLLLPIVGLGAAFRALTS
jgi:hypothetical protein